MAGTVLPTLGCIPRRRKCFIGFLILEHFAPNNSDSPASSEALGAVEPVSAKQGRVLIFLSGLLVRGRG